MSSNASTAPDIQGPTPSPSPPTFVIPAHVLEYNAPIPQYLATKPGIDDLLVSAAVFNPETNKVLLVQRASSDGMPNRWEAPGGSVEPARDATVLAAAARELREESGLVPAAAVALVHTHEFAHEGRTYQKLTFEFEVAEAAAAVTLDPAEHQDYVWASEDEVRGRRVDGRTLVFTFPSQEAALEEAFARRRAGV